MRKIFIICEHLTCGRIKCLFLNKNHEKYKDDETMYFNSELELSTYLDCRFGLSSYVPVMIYKNINTF